MRWDEMSDVNAPLVYCNEFTSSFTAVDAAAAAAVVIRVLATTW